MRARITLTAMIVLLTVQGCTINKSDASDPPPTTPPGAGRPVVLDTRVPGWETSAWLTDDSFCVRMARPRGESQEGKENESIFCDPAPSVLDAVGPPLLPTKPLPYTAPLDPASQEIILIGTVRGAVTTVTVTMFGRTATANVHPLPATNGREVGAYAVWLPRSGGGEHGMNLSDITNVIGRDATGDVVAQLS